MKRTGGGAPTNTRQSIHIGTSQLRYSISSIPGLTSCYNSQQTHHDHKLERLQDTMPSCGAVEHRKEGARVTRGDYVRCERARARSPAELEPQTSRGCFGFASLCTQRADACREHRQSGCQLRVALSLVGRHGHSHRTAQAFLRGSGGGRWFSGWFSNLCGYVPAKQRARRQIRAVVLCEVQHVLVVSRR